MNLIKVFVSIFLLLPLFANSSTDVEVSEEEKYAKWAESVWNSLDRMTGEIKLPNAVATLNVPENFYYLAPKDAEKVLVDVWGNPPGQNTLGMLFPSEMTPFDADSWAVSIQYEEDGYVSDGDADDINYSELLEQMKSDTNLVSQERVKQGYEAIELVGWASPPYYDSATNKLHWAKEIKFANSAINTLNYNIRVLGRKGVLVLNFIAQIDQQQLIETKLNSVLALAEFDQGSKYSDFDPDMDDVAAYGLGALVAGKVIAKTGFLAVAFLFIKKFSVIFIIAIGAFVKRMFKRKEA
ncbi:Uncharacterized membrane-anchored protein-like protein [Moritella viscosa]|uniref:DUF2167 domain-containing protein n=1 Tax=Moritella viscosa TaxID=80854 RepID=UPI000508EEB5|nr:DUF2167 domain-containing protein [Moritella viscosa]CED58891.1 putative exported protein [Moritella viscosa]SHN98418.1 Uncharacterized membrane-anchored protein-like protein [Moritella viscosa]SHO19873.1 Uncharacterized membrane-anchored protein-like protein [Moritella viscosa]